MFRTAAISTTALGLVAAGVALATPQASAMPSDLHPCTDQQIASRVAYSDGGMSKKNYRVEMTNVSSDPCIMRGFPG